MNNIAYCGLACCVCSENDKCVGCQTGGCEIHGWCKNYNCCHKKGLNGCWECSEFPCSGTMLDKPRIRAFARFAKEYGADELAKRLIHNKENGIVYHYDGQHVGDYDKFQCEEEIIKMIRHTPTSVEVYYDALVAQNNDPFHDPEPLKQHMDKWDGQAFIDELQLSKEKNVLEIGVGTGRLAVQAALLCGNFTGIDISRKTIERAKENLKDLKNITLIWDDFTQHEFAAPFDVIYSSLTFMHIEDKLMTINKIAGLLKLGGRFVLSIDKNQAECIDVGFSKIKVYHDNPNDICAYAKAACLSIDKQLETEFAYILIASCN